MWEAPSHSPALTEPTVPGTGLSKHAPSAVAFYIYPLLSRDPEKTFGGTGLEKKMMQTTLCCAFTVLFSCKTNVCIFYIGKNVSWSREIPRAAKQLIHATTTAELVL